MAQLKHTAPRLHRFFLQALARQESLNVNSPTDVLESQVSMADSNELLARKGEEWAVIYSTDPHAGSFINVLIPATLELTTVEVTNL